jgi:hypothetical protein
MNLIEEIEAAASDCDSAETFAAYLAPEQAAELIINSLWWPSIKAALEAAQVMDVLSHGSVTQTVIEGDRLYAARLKFREAMNGEGK